MKRISDVCAYQNARMYVLVDVSASFVCVRVTNEPITYSEIYVREKGTTNRRSKLINHLR